MNAWSTPVKRSSSREDASNSTDIRSFTKTTPENENARIARQQCMENILMNKSEEKIEATAPLYCLLTIFLSILSTIFITSWPQHQSIGDPTYWYETLVLCMTGQSCFATQLLVFTSYFSLGIGIRDSYKTTAAVWVFGALFNVILAYHLYIFWVYVGGFAWPMPYQGYNVMTVGWWAIIGSFWIHSKMTWKGKSNLTWKILWGIIFINCTYVAEVTYFLVQFLFVLTDEKWHVLFVVLILLVREVHVRGLSYIGKKINGSKDLSIEIDAVHLAAIRHILFLSVNLGSTTTPTTSYLILASDFTINLVDCFAIIYYHRKGGESNERKKVGALVTLISNEATEFILPMAYASVLLLSYYGPNAELMGNIKSSNWHYAGIVDINDTIFWLAVMFLVDSLSTVVSTLLLQIFCNINIVKMYTKILKHMGFLLAVQPAYYICEVSFKHYIS